jgi:hypothetical protein
MAIQSKSEISVILTDILLKLERMLETDPHNASLEAAKKTLLLTGKLVKQDAPLTAKDLQALSTAADTLRSAVPEDEGMANHLYDVQDFLALPPS